MNSKIKQRLAELNSISNNKKKKSTSEAILLFIAQATAETNSSIRWLVWLVGIGVVAGIGTLALAIRGL